MVFDEIHYMDDPERGTVLSFDAYEEYVEVPSFDLTTDTVTFAAWINGHKNDNWAGIVMSRGTNATGIGYGANDTLHYTWNNNSGTTYNWVGAPVIPDDEWAFVAVAIEPGKASGYLWQDGTLLSGENTIDHIVQTVDAVEISRDNCCGPSRFFIGLMDDVYIYDRALSDAEVAGMSVVTVADMSGTNVTVTGDSELNSASQSVVTFGALTMQDGGILRTTGRSGVTFQAPPAAKVSDTTIDPAAGSRSISTHPPRSSTNPRSARDSLPAASRATTDTT